MYIAHSPSEKGMGPHYLTDHTETVIKLTISFSKKSDPFSIAKPKPHLHCKQGYVKVSEVFWESLINMWDLDHSAARGKMACSGVTFHQIVNF